MKRLLIIDVATDLCFGFLLQAATGGFNLQFWAIVLLYVLNGFTCAAGARMRMEKKDERS